MTTRPNDDELAKALLHELLMSSTDDDMNFRGYDENCITAVLDLIRQIEARTYERASIRLGEMAITTLDTGAERGFARAASELRALASRGAKP